MPSANALPVPTRTLRGFSRLALDAITQTTHLVEALHATIARAPLPWEAPVADRTRGITGLVYRSIRGSTSGLRTGLDAALGALDTGDDPLSGSASQAAIRAALNGVVGDHLEASDNPLALPMQLRFDGRPLPLDVDALRRMLPNAQGRVRVLVHGLCMSDGQWRQQGHDHGAALNEAHGGHSLYLRYNSGRHISHNGREFAQILEQLRQVWPTAINDLQLIGHSLGGLVIRSACHYGAQAGHGWLSLLRKAVFLGTPHHGAPLERGGNRLQTLAGVTPYTAPLARLGMLRSAGVTDLRHGNLLDEDWAGADRFARQADRRRPVPLPADTHCYAIAATTGREPGDLKDRLLGDGLVPLHSALGLHEQASMQLGLSDAHRRIYPDTHHWGLLSKPAIAAQLCDWLA